MRPKAPKYYRNTDETVYDHNSGKCPSCCKNTATLGEMELSENGTVFRDGTCACGYEWREVYKFEYYFEI